MRRSLIVTLLLAFSSVLMGQQGYNIEVKIKNLPNETLILGYHKGVNLIPLDTAKTDARGNAVFKGKKKLTNGLYFVFLPDRNYVDFLVGDDQKFTVETDTSDLYKSLKIKGSPDNDLIEEYTKYVESKQDKIKELQEKIRTAKNDKQKKKYIEQLKSIKQAIDDYARELAEKNNKLYASKFLLATLEPTVPESIKEPLERYLYMKNHYFDNFDFADPSMLYTPFYNRKIDTYLDQYILQDPDSLIAAVDFLLERAKKNDEVYKYLLPHLFNKYARSKLMIAENVYVHLAEIYIETAYWDNTGFRDKLKDKIAKKKNCLVGNRAMNFQIALLPNTTEEIEKLRMPLTFMKNAGLKLEKEKPNLDDRIYDLSQLISVFLSNFTPVIDLNSINSDYIVLWFWDPECSHCRKETPELHEYWQKELKDKGVTVVAFYLMRNTDDWNHYCNHIGKWFDFVEKHNLYGKGWINGWYPTNDVRINYDINATPKVFLLDKNKKIIAKQIGVKDIGNIIDQIEKAKKDQNK